MAVKTNGSERIFHSAYHYRTGYYNEKRTSNIHKGTDYGVSGKALPQYPPLNFAEVRQIVNKETNGDARGCRVRLEWPELNLGMIMQHLVEGSIKCKVGDILNVNDQVGLTGITGKYSNGTRVSSGVHAHIEVYYIDQSPKAPSNLSTFDFEKLDFDKLEVEQLDKFKAVIKEMLDERLSGNNTKVDSYAKATWDEATKLGITTGERPKGYILRQDVVKIVMDARDKA